MMLRLSSVQSTAGDSSTAQAGSGSPARRARCSVQREVAAGRVAEEHDPVGTAARRALSQVKVAPAQAHARRRA
jgi:hypothetical protein